MALQYTYGKLYTADNVDLASYLQDQEFPMIEVYNKHSSTFDWRGLLCQDDDEEVKMFGLPAMNRFKKMGPHEEPFLFGHTTGQYQQFVNKFGGGFARTREFLARATSADLLKQAEEALDMDMRAIRYEILKSIFNPPSYGHGFYNKTWDSLSGQSAPPNYEANSFNGSHNHYIVTGTATITSIDPFIDAKQHIREHMSVKGKFRGFINSLQQGEVEKLAGWYNTSGPQVANPLTDQTTIDNWTVSLSGIDFEVDDNIPAGYTVILYANGEKPIKFHELKNPSFRGLQLIPGPEANYPIIGSHYERYFMPRVWRRDAGAVLQWATNTNMYTVPTFYA